MHAVILAGGKGTRLYPYTVSFPKPLMPIDDMPIIEILLRRLACSGVDHVTMAVGHLAELLIAFLGDGQRFGLRIDYSREDEPKGTAGPLRMIPDLPDTFLVMNGDLLTTLDYRLLLEHHRQSGHDLTIACHKRQVKIDFGILETDPNGLVRDLGACNIDRRPRRPNRGALATPQEVSVEVERLDQRMPSGALDKCVRPFGVFDREVSKCNFPIALLRAVEVDGVGVFQPSPAIVASPLAARSDARDDDGD